MIAILVQGLGRRMGRARGKGAHTPTPSKTIQRESRIQEALAGVQGGTYESYRAAAKAHQVSFQTLHDRAAGRHQSIQSAARKRQLLSLSQEAALLDWCRPNSNFTTPLHARALRTRVFEICCRRPSLNWVRRFLRRHLCLVMAKPRGLDPKAEAAKQAQKKAENDARTVKINRNAVTKDFDAPLSSYKLKDDFLTIAQALGLAVEKRTQLLR
ncbi:hypothetical protein DFH29DRAFT_1048592 [Suillus ampliporus]|nr:hypothetical protein DFH29DRAFT_1048592 [Suillus ampliporus]